MKNKNKGKNKFWKSEKGITLVALVLTIIVLIILATVAINFAFGQNGIINRAEQARDYYSNDYTHTDDSLANVETYLGYMTGELWDGTTNDKVTVVESTDGISVPVPKGFTASTVDGENSVSDGFVIKQGNDGSATSGVNEFVWIPVTSDDLEEMYQESSGTALSEYEGVAATTEVYSKLRGQDGSAGFGGVPASTTYREPDILIDTTNGDTSTESGRGINLITSVFGFTGNNGEILDQFADMLVADYETNYASTKKYGGFYIGRYELTGSVATPTVQKGQIVLTGKSWYDLYKACKSVVNTEYAKSIMIYGNQWDEVLDWLVDTGEKSSSEVYSDSSRWGNFSDSTGVAATNSGEKRSAGYNEAWKANNIYDLAGNCLEWVQVANGTSSRGYRGGYYVESGSKYPVSMHRSNIVWDANINMSSRLVLYVAL